ncbi:nucleotide sugar dehydrogenase [Chloroflexota bacterium]
MKEITSEPIICVVGLGYVGADLAEAFAKTTRVIGYDTDTKKIESLKQGGAATRPENLFYTADPKNMSQADFIIICVPTPVTKSKDPDLSYIENAARTVSSNMKRGCTVILESTVYPGVTEEVMRPILEESGLDCGEGFKIGYSPERINPGDSEHVVNRVYKVVSGMDEEATDKIAALYGRITPHIFRAKDIKTAEAAKVIENIQRDLNIALVNELALIFDKMGLSTQDVLAAAATKWNFQRYTPGLVGGHCIPVDPYYLVYKAQEFGYHPQVILAGRAINDFMPKHVAEMTIKALNNVGKVIKGSKVLIMGLTYKENVADTRETPVKEIIKELREYNAEIVGYDPLLDESECDFDIKMVQELRGLDAEIDGIVLAVGHGAFQKITLDDLRKITNDNPVLIDARGFFMAEEAEKKGFYYRRL